MKTCALLTVAALISLSCSAGPTPPKTGTPAYYWMSANEAYGKGEYAKTVDWLDKIVYGSSDFVPKARVFKLVVLSGLLQGKRELAERFEYGANNNKDNPMRFRKHVNSFRGEAGRLAAQLGETFAAYAKSTGDVPVEFSYPARGSVAMPLPLNKVAEGQMISESELETVHEQMIQRGVIQEVARAVGAPGDVAKAQTLMKTLPLAVNRATFDLAMAEVLYDASVIFNRQKLGDPARQQFLAKQALAALAGAKADEKRVKDLKPKIEKDLKGLKS